MIKDMYREADSLIRSMLGEAGWMDVCDEIQRCALEIAKEMCDESTLYYEYEARVHSIKEHLTSNALDKFGIDDIPF